MKLCNSCGNEIHPKRLEILPNASQCVSCSTTEKKAGITIVGGEGDHTFNDVVVVDYESFKEYQDLYYRTYGKRPDLPEPSDEEIIDGEEDDDDDELNDIEEINFGSEELED